jgi:hypothetical protein
MNAWLVSLLSEAKAHNPALVGTIPEITVRLEIGIIAQAIALLVFAQTRIGRGLGKGQSIFFAAFALWLVAARCLQFPFAIDDAYLDFRHVRNLVEHGSFDYNIGEPIMGFTSHLHYLLLAAIAYIFRVNDYAYLSQNINIVADAVNYFLIYYLLTQSTGKVWVGLAGAALFSATASLVEPAALGKEDPILLLLLTWLFISLQKKQLSPAFAAAGLVFLTRPEGIILGGIVGLWLVARNGVKSIVKAIPISLIIVGYYLILYLHFSTILPHGGVAKAAGIYYGSKYTSLRDIEEFLQQLLLVREWRQGYLWLIALLLIVFAVFAWDKKWRIAEGCKGLFTTFRATADHCAWLYIYLFALLVISVFFIAGSPFMFRWYLSWYSPLLYLCVPLVAGLALENYRIVLGCVVGVNCLFCVLSPNVLLRWDDWHQRLLLYRDAATFLDGMNKSNCRLAVSEDGMLGYTYLGYIIATDGLVSDHVLKYFPVPVAKRSTTASFSIPPQLIYDMKPDFMITLDTFAKNGVIEEAEFQKQYTTMKMYPTQLWNSTGLYVYGRKNSNCVAGR